MSPTQKRSARASADPAPGALGDPLVEAALAVHRELAIEAQVRAVLEAAASWTSAGGALGFAVAPNGHALAAVATERGLDDPRLVELAALRTDQVGAWVGEGPRAYTGLGPFHASVAGAFGADPAHLLALPLAAPDGRRAGLVLLALRERPGGEATARLERFLELVRPAFGNALRVLAIRELVIKDDTASCFNRRYFEEFLPEELARASRFRAPVSLIFLDMDNLKEVNNRHGHAMGSRTLFEVATRVRGRIRKFDKLFRFGGDEFCIVLPETDWHGAMEVAERVRDAIGAQPFLREALGDDRGVRMSASLGIASFPLHARTQEELVQRADRAMQGVKRAGKNAIGVAEIEEGR